MKKTYQTPRQHVTVISMSHALLAGSGGVTNGSTPGNSFNEGDESYARGLDLDFSF